MAYQFIHKAKGSLIGSGDYVFRHYETPLFSIGGRIFYDNGSNGATYTFYDSSKNVLSDTSISGLANAVYYSVNGTPSADRWYVYDNTNGLQGTLQWGGWGTAYNVTTDTIGSGKTNSAIVVAGLGDTSGTVWYYIKNTMNAGSIGGCTDWYIGSVQEQEELRTSGLVDWYDGSNTICSSVEYSDGPAYSAMTWGGSTWTFSDKAFYNNYVAMRSF